MTAANTKGFIDLYYEWMEEGQLPSVGLCHSLEAEEELIEIFTLFTPTPMDYEELKKEGKVSPLWTCADDLAEGCWGADLHYNDSLSQRAYTFGSLRQTIILFCAALNNEL